ISKVMKAIGERLDKALGGAGFRFVRVAGGRGRGPGEGLAVSLPRHSNAKSPQSRASRGDGQCAADRDLSQRPSARPLLLADRYLGGKRSVLVGRPRQSECSAAGGA